MKTTLKNHLETAIVSDMRSAPLRKRLAFGIGELLVVCLQKRSETVEFGHRVGSMRIVDRIIRNGLRARAIRQKDYLRLRNMHRAFWSKEAQVFGESYAIRFREQFLESDAEVFDHVDELMNSQPIDYVYEIGCGNGHVLEYMSERFAIAEKLIGIDIDEALIRQNRARFGADRMQFVQADALEWMRKHARNSCLIVTNGGVFEYFLEKELVELFAAASGLGPIIVALIETIGIDHDLERDGATHVYGRELSFSHNYPRLLRDAGFQMHHESERVDQNGNRWLRIVAKSGF